MELETYGNRPQIEEHQTVLREKVLRLAVIGACLVIVVAATYAVIITDSNPVALFVALMAPLALVAGIVQPRLGLSVLLVACCYLDLVKRIAYWFGFYGAGNQGLVTLQMDTLSFAPITLVGIFLGIIGRRVFVTKRIIEEGELKAGAFAILANLLIFITYSKAGHGLGESLAYVANAGIYLLLLLIVPSLFSSAGDIVNFLKAIFSVFLPCALYGIWQGKFGYTDLDIAWLKSGITITGNLLFDVKARAFGTLASPHPYSLLYWFFLMGVYLYFNAKRYRIFYLLGSLIYAVGLFYAYTRGAWIAMVIAIGGYFCFKSRVLTLWFYGVSISVFALVAINSQYLIDHMGAYADALPTETASQQMAFRIGTYGDRLIGFTNWMHSPQLWSWFGIRESYNTGEAGPDAYVHDMFGEILVHYGAVGLIGALAVGVLSLIYFHKTILRIPDERDRKLATLLLSMTASQFIAGGLGGASYNVFPWNFFIWLAVGFLIVLCRRKSSSVESKEDGFEKVRIKGRSPFSKREFRAQGSAS